MYAHEKLKPVCIYALKKKIFEHALDDVLLLFLNNMQKYMHL